MFNLCLPNFSVLMSVYKKEIPEYLDVSIRSIVEQSVIPSEIILVKDGPLTSELEVVVKKWKKFLGPTLKVIALDENVGLAEALNVGLSECSNKIVARMDTDDKALRFRFESQLLFLENNKDISCVSALVEEYDESLQRPLKIRLIPEKHQEITKFCKRRNPISHPAVMFRKDDVISVGGYPNVYPEDYFLWLKMIQEGYKFANIQKVLLHMRTGDDFVARRGVSFLKGEIKIYHYMFKTGFIGAGTFFLNIVIRSTLRLSPSNIKILFYKFFR